MSIRYIDGTAGNDLLLGSDANEVMNGWSGNDTLIAGHGNDTLYGGDGDDELNGRVGSDHLDGGAGTDLAYFANAEYTGGAIIRLDTGIVFFLGTGDVTTMVSIENAIGTQGNDTITGDAGANWLYGFLGNDSLFGGNGNDTLIGGLGNDTIDGGAGFNTAVFTDASLGAGVIDLGLGRASFANGEIDTVRNIQRVIAGSGNDTILGTNAAEILEGGAGNDTLIAGDGNDSLYGGDGNDELNGGSGLDLLDGGAGTDTGYFANAAHAAGAVIRLDLGTATVTGNGDSSTLVSIENAIGTEGADTIVGDAGANWLYGFLGNDSLFGGDGNDTVRGGAGNDTIDGGAGFNTAVFTDAGLAAAVIDLGLGQASFTNGETDIVRNIQHVITGSGNDLIIGTGSAEIVEGRDGNDTLVAGHGNDTLYGGNGADTLRGGLGDDFLTGGEGNDFFRFDRADVPNMVQTDRITDFHIGEDRIDYRDWGYNINNSNSDTYTWWKSAGVQIQDQNGGVAIAAYGGAYTLYLENTDYTAFMTAGSSNFLFL